ncbi:MULTISPECIES: CotS family spore coat protein [unclassified Paenibacillus]|uniref:CotS family spore coat protein n=1 Tax=unclassified Paenibacillus TaxID=185978 RepID=UPI00363923B1
MDMNNEELLLGRQLMTEHYPHVDIAEIEVIQGGGIKTVWKLRTSLGTVCLKRIRKSIPIVKFTTAAQAYLYEKGALVCGIIPTEAGGLYFVHEGYALVLYNWIEGSDLEMDKNPEHLYAGLKGLAQFHQDTVGFVPPDDCETYNRMGVWLEHYEKMLGELKQWKSKAEAEVKLETEVETGAAMDNLQFYKLYLSTVDEMIYRAEEAIRLLDCSCYAEWVSSIGEYGYLCHQDYGKGNALQTDAGVYVLDLDNLTYDIPIRDVRKLVTKRIEQLDNWDLEEIERMIRCYESILPLTQGQKEILYIDLLFPHKYYGYVKNPFKKGEPGELKKLMKNYQFDLEALPALRLVLNING